MQEETVIWQNDGGLVGELATAVLAGGQTADPFDRIVYPEVVELVSDPLASICSIRLVHRDVFLTTRAFRVLREIPCRACPNTNLEKVIGDGGALALAFAVKLGLRRIGLVIVASS